MFLKDVLIKLILLLCFLGFFVDGTTSNTTCSCAQTLKASVSLDDCKCHLTKYCVKEFWKNSDSAPASDESAMDITIMPYKLGFNFAYPQLPALNISFRINDERIKGFTFVFQEGCFLNAPLCRFLDFNSYKSSIKNAVFHNAAEFYFFPPWENSCAIEVKGLNSQLIPIYHKRFLTKVPSIDQLEQGCAMLSRWKSFVTLDVTSYKEESMNMTFTTPPEKCNVTSFKVRLIGNNDLEPWEILEEKTYKPVIYKLLHGIRPGVNYKVEIAINDKNNLTCKNSCGISSSPNFSLLDDSGIHVLSIIFIVIGIVSVILIAVCIWKIRKSRGEYGETVKVFLAYSYDVEQHKNVIKCLAEYLKQYCGCEIMLDIWDVGSEDPHLWASDRISTADYILIIWSRGAMMKIRKDNTKVLINEPAHLGSDLFSTAMAYIIYNINKEFQTPRHWRNLRKFVHITFPYVPSKAIPSGYEYLSHFNLPSGFNSLLCHLHGRGQSPFSLLSPIKSLVSCLQCYPSMPFSDPKTTKEGRNLLEAISEMNLLEKQGDWLPMKEGIKVDDMGPLPSVSDNDSIDIKSVHLESDISKRDEIEMQDAVFPPHVLTLPIFGAENNEASNPCQLLHRLFYETSNSDPTDDPLIEIDHQNDLPSEIFGPKMKADHLF